MREMILATDPQGIAAALRGMAERPDSSELLPTINVRTLVLVGQEDAISPADEMRKLAAAIPARNSRSCLTRGTWPPWRIRQRSTAPIAGFLANELHAR